jgi:hypothetical protein
VTMRRVVRQPNHRSQAVELNTVFVVGPQVARIGIR